MAEKKTWRNLEDPKSTTIRVRIDNKTIQKLDECCSELNTTRSEILRRGIDKVHNDLPKKD